MKPFDIIEAEHGESIYNAAVRAIDLAKTYGCTLTLVHNTKCVRVNPKSFADDICTIWSLTEYP